MRAVLRSADRWSPKPRMSATSTPHPAPRTLHLLVVDDDDAIVALVRRYFEAHGFRVSGAGDGDAMRVALGGADAVDLVLLDLGLPGEDGFELTRYLREHWHGPVIIVSGRDEAVDRIVGLELGADDYVTKPFSVRELVLRVGAVLRRGSGTVSTPELRLGPLAMDVERHRVTVDGKEVALTALEFRLLHTLLSRQGRVQTRERLLEDVWGMHGDITTRTVDTHVKRLREKLGEAGKLIETVRGVGYRIVESLEAA